MDKKTFNQKLNELEGLQTFHRLHEAGSQNPRSFFKWEFEFINKEKESGKELKVLELGCGNGKLWLENKDNIKGMDLILSELTEERLNVAKENLKDIQGKIKYETIDALDIPYEDNTFDLVIANQTLYFLENVEKGLKEIRRVLKPKRKLIASTSGDEDMKGYGETLINYDDSVELPPNRIIDKFKLQNGREILEPIFQSVESYGYENELVITDSEPFIDFTITLSRNIDLSSFVNVDKISDFENYLENTITEKSGIHIKKEMGVFIARK